MRDPDRLEPYVRRLRLALQDRHYDRARAIIDDFERTLAAEITPDTLLTELDGLPARVAGDLERAGVRTVGDALARTPAELQAMRLVGAVAVRQLVQALSSRELRSTS
jgi:hypothetical protein